jgi:hypothetical protein
MIISQESVELYATLPRTDLIALRAAIKMAMTLNPLFTEVRGEFERLHKTIGLAGCYKDLHAEPEVDNWPHMDHDA